MEASRGIRGFGGDLEISASSWARPLIFSGLIHGALLGSVFLMDMAEPPVLSELPIVIEIVMEPKVAMATGPKVEKIEPSPAPSNSLANAPTESVAKPEKSPPPEPQVPDDPIIELKEPPVSVKAREVAVSPPEPKAVAEESLLPWSFLRMTQSRQRLRHCLLVRP